MAQPVGTFSSYDAEGIREDLSDMIYDISPSETPFYTMCGKVKASNTYHEWMTDSLRSSGANAHIEGDDTTAVARTATTRLGNYLQIFKDAVVIPDTDEGLDKAGRKREISYQSLKIAKEQKLDIEKALLDNNARVAGDDTTARELAGVGAWLTTNTVFESTTGADPVTIGATARTDDSTPVAFSQARFDTAMQAAWDSGGRPEKVFLSSFQMNVALGFDGNNNQRATVIGTDGKVVNNMNIYVTPWGEVEFVMSRECRSRDVFIMQKDMWKVAVLRGTKNVPLAKTGDSTKRQVVTELTLCAANEAANAAVYDNTTS